MTEQELFERLRDCPYLHLAEDHTLYQITMYLMPHLGKLPGIKEQPDVIERDHLIEELETKCDLVSVGDTCRNAFPDKSSTCGPVEWCIVCRAAEELVVLQHLVDNDDMFDNLVTEAVELRAKCKELEKHDIPGLLAMADETGGLRSDLRRLDNSLIDLRAKNKILQGWYETAQKQGDNIVIKFWN